VHVRESNSRLVDHKFDTLTTTPPSHLYLLWFLSQRLRRGWSKIGRSWTSESPTDQHSDRSPVNVDRARHSFGQVTTANHAPRTCWPCPPPGARVRCSSVYQSINQFNQSIFIISSKQQQSVSKVTTYNGAVQIYYFNKQHLLLLELFCWIDKFLFTVVKCWRINDRSMALGEFRSVTCHMPPDTTENTRGLNPSLTCRTYSIYIPGRNRRLSWLGGLVTYWDGLSISNQKNLKSSQIHRQSNKVNIRESGDRMHTEHCCHYLQSLFFSEKKIFPFGYGVGLISVAMHTRQA